MPAAAMHIDAIAAISYFFHFDAADLRHFAMPPCFADAISPLFRYAIFAADARYDIFFRFIISLPYFIAAILIHIIFFHMPIRFSLRHIELFAILAFIFITLLLSLLPPHDIRYFELPAITLIDFAMMPPAIRRQPSTRFLSYYLFHCFRLFADRAFAAWRRPTVSCPRPAPSFADIIFRCHADMLSAIRDFISLIHISFRHAAIFSAFIFIISAIFITHFHAFS